MAPREREAMTIQVNSRHVLAALVAAVAAASAFAQWHQATHVEHGTIYYYDTPLGRCQARGIDQFDDRGEWPVTREGIDSRSVINASCDRDVNVFGADEPWSVQR